MENTVNSSPVLICKGISKRYKGGVHVFNNFDFSLPRGRIVGLLGPNGCGKSTLMKIIAGILAEDAGEIVIDGVPRSESTNALVSYLPERTYLDSSLKVYEAINLFASFLKSL